MWHSIGEPIITPTTHTARDASSNTISFLGEINCQVELNKLQVSGKLFVTEHNINLFGIDLISAFNLWDEPINAFCNNIKSTVIKFNTKDAIQCFKSSYPSVFNNSSIGHCTKVKVKLSLKENAIPIFRPKRPVAYQALNVIDNELERLRNANIITPIDYSEWAAPIVVVKKPNGTIRICADYSTGLNKQLEPNHYPIPTPEQIFSKLSNKSVFAQIDLSDAYLQIEVDEATSRLLTINTHRGLFQFNRLAPGITSAPGHFQQIVETMLGGIDNCSVYFDDICVAGSNEIELNKTLIVIFQRLKEYGMRVKFEKCKFFVPEICYLGNIISKEGIKPDAKKIAPILNMPEPKTVSELRSFLGAINFYGKYIKNMRDIRFPLDNLLKSNSKWQWSRDCQISFDKFKQILSSNLLLTHYSPTLPLIVAADASNVGIGACIYHEFLDGAIKIIYHASKSLTPAEQNYSQIEKEGLALIYAVTKFHKYIFGRKFILMTDHKPLLSIFGAKKGIPVHSASRLQRWSLKLLAYDFEIRYTSTHEFGHADILSRLINKTSKPDEDYIIASTRLENEVLQIVKDVTNNFPIHFKSIQDATAQCPVLSKVCKFVKSNNWPLSSKELTGEVAQFFKHKDNLTLISNCLLFSDRVVIPSKFQKRLLNTIHESHPGMQRMKSLARGYMYWPGMDKQIELYVRSCSKCAEVAKAPIKCTLQSWPIPNKAWERIHIDYAGPVRGFSYLVIVDAYSKWPEVYEVSNITSSTTVSILKEVMSRFGNVDVIVSDNGTQFASHQFSEFCNQRGIQHIRTSPYHPQSNGLAEKFVDTLKRTLSKMEKNTCCKNHINTFLHWYRATPHPNTPNGESPSQIFLGRQMKTNLNLLKPSSSSSTKRNYKQENQFNKKHGAKYRQCNVKQRVYASCFSHNKFKWLPGLIIERIGSVNYNVLLDCGKLVRKHI